MLVASVDPDDQQATAKIRRPLLQEIILWEFGSDLRQDPEFGPMLDGIEQAFMMDAASARFPPRACSVAMSTCTVRAAAVKGSGIFMAVQLQHAVAPLQRLCGIARVFPTATGQQHGFWYRPRSAGVIGHHATRKA